LKKKGVVKTLKELGALFLVGKEAFRKIGNGGRNPKKGAGGVEKKPQGIVEGRGKSRLQFVLVPAGTGGGERKGEGCIKELRGDFALKGGNGSFPYFKTNYYYTEGVDTCKGVVWRK